MVRRRMSSLLWATPAIGVLSGVAHAAGVPITPVTLTAEVTIPASNTSGSLALVTVPAGMRLVIQTISYYRNAAAAGSIGQIFIAIPPAVYLAAPNVSADGSLFPGATIALTGYAAAGTSVQCKRLSHRQPRRHGS